VLLHEWPHPYFTLILGVFPLHQIAHAEALSYSAVKLLLYNVDSRHRGVAEHVCMYVCMYVCMTVFSNAEVHVAGWCVDCVTVVVSYVDAVKAHFTKVLARHQAAQVSTELASCQHCVTVLLDSAGSFSLSTDIAGVLWRGQIMIKRNNYECKQEYAIQLHKTMYLYLRYKASLKCRSLHNGKKRLSTFVTFSSQV